MSVPAEVIEFEPRNTRGWPKNKRQLDFALRIVQHGDGNYEAGVEVGYSKSYARCQAWKLAEKLMPFMAFLQDKKNEVAAKKYDVTSDVVLRHMAAIGLQSWKDYVRVVYVKEMGVLIGVSRDKLTDLQALAVESWTTEVVESDNGPVLNYKYVLHDKKMALVNLGRHLGMFSEKLMLELNMRHSQAEQIDFSAVPQDELRSVIETLEKIQENAKKARAIEGESKRL